ncbi:MAG: HAD hydrolase family protein [bacterium]|nr:HAD hydrolase family protein [bacterium]
MRYEGLVLDIDDTLLRMGSEAVRPDELKAIQRLIAQGVVLVLATGRTRFMAQ